MRQEVIPNLLALKTFGVPSLYAGSANCRFLSIIRIYWKCAWDDAAEKSLKPFMELIQLKPGKDRNLWERQLAVLRIAERLDKAGVEKLIPALQNHPHDSIRQWLRERAVQEKQKVIHAEKGGYELVFIPGGTFMIWDHRE
ncbi:MAG: hypothetical protein R2941_06490 [Desulfobacterales bacterium]